MSESSALPDIHVFHARPLDDDRVIHAVQGKSGRIGPAAYLRTKEHGPTVIFKMHTTYSSADIGGCSSYNVPMRTISSSLRCAIFHGRQLWTTCTTPKTETECKSCIVLFETSEAKLLQSCGREGGLRDRANTRNDDKPSEVTIT